MFLLDWINDRRQERWIRQWVRENLTPEDMIAVARVVDAGKVTTQQISDALSEALRVTVPEDE